MPTSVTEFKGNILAELGAPILEIELDECQWDAIVARTKRWFSAKKGILTATNVPIVPNIHIYDFPPNCAAVVDVILPLRSDIQSLLSLGFFDIVPLNALNLGAVTSAFNSYSAYSQILQALGTRRRIFSADPDWEITPNNQIMISGGSGICSTTGTGQMMVVYKLIEWDVSQLVDRDIQIFYEYMRAVAMQTLAHIRRKYRSVPIAGGATELDAAELMEEAKADFERLENEISDSQGAMGLIFG